MPEQKIVLRAEHLGINFGSLKAVDDFNLELCEGELVGLIGPNGAGKTTVFNMLTGVYEPTEGKEYLLDSCLNGKKVYQIVAEGIARTFQNIRLFREMTVLENVMAAFTKDIKYGMGRTLTRSGGDAVAGRSYIDPEIESRVQEVTRKDERSPMALLEPSEQQVARMLAQGMSNEQIAARLGFRDKRTISRINGQIYAAWGLAEDATDEKVTRTRAALIVAAGRLLVWDAAGAPAVQTASGWAPWAPG